MPNINTPNTANPAPLGLFGSGSHILHTIAGYEGILCGSFAFYEALALTVNEKRGMTVFPL